MQLAKLEASSVESAMDLAKTQATRASTLKLASTDFEYDVLHGPVDASTNLKQTQSQMQMQVQSVTVTVEPPPAPPSSKCMESREAKCKSSGPFEHLGNDIAKELADIKVGVSPLILCRAKLGEYHDHGPATMQQLLENRVFAVRGDYVHIMTNIEAWVADGSSADALYFTFSGTKIALADAAVARKIDPGLELIGRFLSNDTMMVSDQIELLIYLAGLDKDESVLRVVKCFYESGLIAQDHHILKALRDDRCADVLVRYRSGTDDEIKKRLLATMAPGGGGIIAKWLELVLYRLARILKDAKLVVRASFGRRRSMRVFL